MPLLRRAPPFTHNKVLFQQKGNIGLAAHVPTSSARSRCEVVKLLKFYHLFFILVYYLLFIIYHLLKYWVAAYVPTSSAGSRCEVVKQAMDAAQCLLFFRSARFFWFIIPTQRNRKQVVKWRMQYLVSKSETTEARLMKSFEDLAPFFYLPELGPLQSGMQKRLALAYSSSSISRKKFLQRLYIFALKERFK